MYPESFSQIFAGAGRNSGSDIRPYGFATDEDSCEIVRATDNMDTFGDEVVWQEDISDGAVYSELVVPGGVGA